MAAKPNVVVPPKEFYVRQRDSSYSDWRDAFHREYIQNAVDAGAKTIRVVIGDVPGRGMFGRSAELTDAVRVSVRDDGSGMTRDVLENVFFHPGRSSKSGPDAIGGFGTARLMLCYSQDNYRIRSGELVVEGDGGEYIVHEAADYASQVVERRDAGLMPEREADQTLAELTATSPLRGTEFDIDVAPVASGWYPVSAAILTKKLERYVQRCQLGAEVILNGQTLPQLAKRGPVRRRLNITLDGKDVPFATVHTSRSEKAAFKNDIIVRVAGAEMFSLHTSAKMQVIVELEPTLARVCLTDSRDRLKGAFGQALDEFRSELERDAAETLKDDKENVVVTKGGKGGFRFVPGEDPAPIDFSFQPWVTNADGDAKVMVMDDLAQMPESVVDAITERLRGPYPTEGLLANFGQDTLDTLKAAFETASAQGAATLSSLHGTQVGFLLTNELNTHLRRRNLLPGVEMRNADMHDIHIRADEFEDERVRQSIRRWKPEYWVRLGDSRKAPNRGMAAHRFLTAWTICCRNAFVAVSQSDRSLFKDGVDYGTGFFFGKPTERYVEGQYRDAPTRSTVLREDDKHLLLVNPILPDGTPGWDIDADGRAAGGQDAVLGWRDLEAQAIRDVCRVVSRTYDRDFVDLMTSAVAVFDHARNRREFTAAEEVVMAAYGRGKVLVQEMDETPVVEKKSRKNKDVRPGQKLLAHAAPAAAMVVGLAAEQLNESPALGRLASAVVTPVSEGLTAIDTDAARVLDEAVTASAAQRFEVEAAPEAPDVDTFKRDLDGLDGVELDGIGELEPTPAPTTAPASDPFGDDLDDLDAGAIDGMDMAAADAEPPPADDAAREQGPGQAAAAEDAFGASLDGLDVELTDEALSVAVPVAQAQTADAEKSLAAEIDQVMGAEFDISMFGGVR